MITVYAGVLEQAARDDDGVSVSDQQIIEENFDGYIDWLNNKLADELGGQDQVLIDYAKQWGPSAHSTTRVEHEAWQDTQGFWVWYN